MNTIRNFRHQSGFNILEVLIAIAIFAIGLLALSALQGSLTRVAAESNLRTVASNIAERTIEDMRAFGRIDTDPAGVINAYNDIVDSAPETITDGVYTFTRDVDVIDYFYDPATDTFSETAPAGVAVSDFKLLEVNVTWGDDTAGFVVDEAASLAAGALQAGSVTVAAIVSSISTQGGARTNSQVDDNTFTPTVNYTPGLNPDIVSLSLDDNKFKESLTPEPEVIRNGELVETRFDVVTYSQTDDSALFLRREEFIAVSCECEMYVDATSTETGRRPTVWAGDEYIEPEWVGKPYGRSANNTQSTFCDTCCQDHHDGGATDGSVDSAIQVYDPFRPSSEYYDSDSVLSGDHFHYSRDRRGNLSLLETACAPDASSCTSTYVEACRLVRKDGFFRVAQDFRQEGLNVFPYDFLVAEADVSAYSSYVTGAVDTFVGATSDGYESTPPTLTPPSRGTAEGDLTSDSTSLPTALGADFQQMRSRGIYIDYLSDDLRSVISCLEGGGDKTSCKQGDVELDKTGSENILELLPFFEVQLTFLTRWGEDPIDTPVDTTNEALETGNTHSRGVASKESTAGSSLVAAAGHTGVLGFTDTDPIDLNFDTDTRDNNMTVVIDDSATPTPTGTTITGTIRSGVRGVHASNIEIEASGAVCNRTPDGFSCLVPASGTPTLKIFNYKKAARSIHGCSDALTRTTSDTSSAPFAIFSLSGTTSDVDYIIWVEEDGCTAAPSV
ncbi:MAG: prepilin-type N-terminal cleavage/methylation domain-containing protein [Xanthomonadales bacterium]|nr:prepilin-type N-terminal cleavage/methylation domain-containing protein [Xanthomonadales bacterium]